jgi:hypothetical protein
MQLNIMLYGRYDAYIQITLYKGCQRTKKLPQQWKLWGNSYIIYAFLKKTNIYKNSRRDDDNLRDDAF